MRRPSVSLTGVGGGHDLDLRGLEQKGMILLGHLAGTEDSCVSSIHARCLRRVADAPRGPAKLVAEGAAKRTKNFGGLYVADSAARP